MEEFQESDILWPELEEDQEKNGTGFDAHSTGTRTRHDTSAPIRIPSKPPVSRSWTAGLNYNCNGIDMHDDDHDDDGDDYNGTGTGTGTLSKSMVPPHILVSRRYTDQMAFPVRFGNGRKLKGRDLRVMRNSILRMTGYLEK